MKQSFFIIVFLLLTAPFAKAQSVTNINFEKSEKQVIIYYDLSGDPGSSWNISVYCSQDGGKIWGNPLQKLSGAFGNEIKPGKNQRITWDVLEERDMLEGEISFKVEAVRNEDTVKDKTEVTYPPFTQPVNKVPEKAAEKLIETPALSADYYKYKKAKSFWLVSTLVTGAVGTFSYLQANKYYNEYKDATTDASSLHQKVKTFDTITPMAFGIAGFCAVEFILKAGKQSKAQKQSLGFYPVPLNNGGGIGLAYTF
jgi:hypothetical protein